MIRKIIGTVLLGLAISAPACRVSGAGIPAPRPGECKMEKFQDPKFGTVVRCVDPRSTKVQMEGCTQKTVCDDYGHCRTIVYCPQEGTRPRW